ncbi:MAG: hypothetical protein ABJE95_17170 [Byssovorax sp.]
MIPLEQTLHGYDEGHRLLASSTRLEAEEERTIDLLSDLSGYLPHGTDFEQYETGYPCGRFYVLSRTWPDRQGKRTGTVFTHSLLIPRSACAEIRSVTSLSAHFRLPSHPVDRASYQESLRFSPFESPEPLLSPVARKHLAALWFGQDLRPLLWTDPDTADEAAHLLWSWLPPWIRADHSFCTFALQPRYLGQNLFDWLAIARGADGLFYSLRDRTLRCDGRSLPNGTSALVEAPWVAEIAEAHPDEVQALWNEAVELGLPRIPASELRVFLRYREFRARAETNLTAAFTRVDLLRRLAPQTEQATAEKTEALWTCLRHARAIPPSARNLLVALDLLARDPPSLAPHLGSEIGNFLAESLEARAEAQPDVAVRVMDAATSTDLATSVREGVYGALHKHQTEPSAAVWVRKLGALASALIERAPTTAVEILEIMPSGARLELVSSIIEATRVGVTSALAEGLRRGAEALDDLALLGALTSLVEPAALLASAEKIVSRTGAADRALLANIVAALGVDNLIEWIARYPTDRRIPALMLDAVASALGEPSGAVHHLSRMLPGAAGVLVLAVYAERHRGWDPTTLLETRPDVVTSILEMVKDEARAARIDDLVPIAVSLAEEDWLLDAFEPAGADRWQRAPWATDVLGRLIPTVVQRFFAGTISRQQLLPWLVSMPSQVQLRAKDGRRLGEIFASTRGKTAFAAIELLSEPAFAQLRSDPHLVRACLEAWGAQSVRDIALLVPAWTALLRTFSDPAVYATACAVTLRVVFDHPDAALAPLAETAFAVAHRESLKYARHGWLVGNVFSFLFRENWDHAKQLRDRLARAWVNNDWPPLSLLRAAQKDEDIFADLVKSAEECSGGKKALRRLWKTARNAPKPELGQDRMLAKLPRHVRED